MSPILTKQIPDLLIDGPLIDLHIGVGSAAEAALLAAGQPVPPPVLLTGMIDTGATHCVIQQGLPAKLGLTPVGNVVLQSASHANILCLQYMMMVYFRNGAYKEVKVTEMTLPSPQFLIGRDLLSHGVFVYIGTENIFSLSF